MVAHRPSGNDVECRQVWRISPSRLVAVATISLIVNFLLVVDVTASSADRRANRCAFATARNGANQRADACCSRRTPDRFAGRVLAVVIIVVVFTIAPATIILIITSVIVVVVVVIGYRIVVSAPAAVVLRHCARSGGR